MKRAGAKPRLSYVLPVHNDAQTLPDVVAALVARLESFPGSEVILVENGSWDGSAWVCETLVDLYEQHRTRVIAAASRRGRS